MDSSSGFVCATCGELHEGVPLSFGADYPDVYANMSSDDRENRSIVGDSQCIVDGSEFFLRGALEIPIIDKDEVFVWGLWARVHERDYDEVSQTWEQEGREHVYGPYEARIANSLAEYPETLNLGVTLHVQRVGKRPLIVVDEVDHPLAQAQQTGMTLHAVYELARRLLRCVPLQRTPQ